MGVKDFLVCRSCVNWQWSSQVTVVILTHLPVDTESVLMLLAAACPEAFAWLMHDTRPAISSSFDVYHTEKSLVGLGIPHQTQASSGHSDDL